MVEIREVTTKSDLKKYIQFPNDLYRDVPQYIPPMFGDELTDWDRTKNPAFGYCDAKCFLAYRDGKIVGRIGAIHSRSSNEKWNTNRVRFTQVDFIDDYEVSAALFGAVESFARSFGCTEVHGPLGFSDLDREGLLVEGFDRKSMFITYYNHPYYREHLERLGYSKDVDWIEYLLTIPYDEKTTAHFQKISDYVCRHSRLHVVDLRSKRKIKPYIRKVFELLNVAYAGLYSTVDLNEEQIRRYTNKFLPMINPDLVCFVTNDRDELIAFGIAAPSMADALKKCNGKLFPTGFVGVLRSLKKNDTIDLFLIAVRPDYQKTGVNAILINHVLKGCHKMGVKVAETGPQLEKNAKILAQWKTFDKEQHKRRRCFIKHLSAETPASGNAPMADMT